MKPARLIILSVALVAAGGAAFLAMNLTGKQTIVQMPAGIPVGTLAIGRAGAINAALLAASIVGLGDAKAMAAVERWRAKQTDAVAKAPKDDAPPAHR